jgi:hypothetical protein
VLQNADGRCRKLFRAQGDMTVQKFECSGCKGRGAVQDLGFSVQGFRVSGFQGKGVHKRLEGQKGCKFKL